MNKQPTINRFIGRAKEITFFQDWLDNANASPILYFYDAAEEPERKGGVGKSYLLRYCADLARNQPDFAVVTADFFNLGDRDNVFLAERVIQGLQKLFPTWKPTGFQDVLKRFREKSLLAEEDEFQIRRLLATELAQDLKSLPWNTEENKTLLIFLDTFETIEQNPELAVLFPSQLFPDTYQIPFIRFVIAGRNRLNSKHPNWQGREHEIASVPVEPFDRQEMMEYIEAESLSHIPTGEQQINALYKHTEGRPILIGLVTDVLNHRILKLEELLTVRQADFERYLVEQINFLENPLNWVTLSMAHVYHRFELAMMNHILRQVELTESIEEISREALAEKLPELSFVRQAGTSDSFVLHDEMQRLVTRYCWPKHDADLRVRKAISQCMIEYYEHELGTQNNEQKRQIATIELLYHQLYVDLDKGLEYLQEQFQRAQLLRQLNFARLLFLEASKFHAVMSLAHQNTLQLLQAQLLRTEENPQSIEVIEDLKKNTDPSWLEQNKANFFFEAGRCYSARSLLQEARASLTDALDAVQENEQLKAFILSFLGGVCRNQGQYLEAIRYFEQTCAIVKAQGDRFNYANTLSTIGNVMSQQGRYEEAMRRCKIALQIRQDLFEQKEISELHIGHSLTTLGVIYLRSGNVLEAENYLKQASDIYNRVNYKSGIAAIYNHFGNIELRRGDTTEARSWFLKGEQAAKNVNMEQTINSLNKLGRICLELEQSDMALSYLQQAISTARQVPDYFQLVESLIDMAKVMEEMQQEDRAEAFLQEAEEIAKREQYANLRADIESQHAKTALGHKNYSEAFVHLEQYCYYTLQYNANEYSGAVRRTTDALLAIPVEERASMVQQVIKSWTERGLAEKYPNLINACEEVREWSL